MDREALDRLVDLGDLDSLLRMVDQAAAADDWSGLVQLRDACRFALETGRQLWPAASFAEYRLALDAPGPWAARVLVEGAGQFSVGPLSEVAASTHPWAELAPHVEAGPLRAFVAHERVLRGEDLSADATVDPTVLDLPLVLAPWEPTYPPVAYAPDGILEAPPPERPTLVPVSLPSSVGGAVADDDGAQALREVVRAWTSGSNGRADVVAVAGNHLAALAALGVPADRARVAEVALGDAVAWLQWAAASGGAYGRRRGGAAGRFSAWWAVAALGGAIDDWPLPAGDVGAVAGALRWFVWDAHEPVTGWQLRLAIWDPDDDLAWAISATDAS